MDFLDMDAVCLKEKLRMPSLEVVDLDPLKLNVVEDNHPIFTKMKILKFREETFNLPPPETYFCTPTWKLLPMQILEDEVNSVKSLLNDIQIDLWHDHTRKMNTVSSVIKEIRGSYSHEFCSVAWCKLFEILSLHDAIPRVTQEAARQLNEIMLHSVHLCEAPGAFVSALNHYLKTKYSTVNWKWIASTLNPYFEGNDRSEALIQDQLILSSFSNWAFLNDNTGNIMNYCNIMSLKEEARKLKYVQLVTADGSIDCADSPEEQEANTSDLHYCEIMAALVVLDKGGSFVLKMFTFFTCNSISKLFLLSCLFKEVEVVKPAMSKSGNSEVYIICRDYMGSDFLSHEKTTLLHFIDKIPAGKSMFPLEAIPKEFLNRVIDCSFFFASCQVQVIEQNVKTFPYGKGFYSQMWLTKETLAQKWLEKTQLAPLRLHDFIFNLKKSKKKYYFKNVKADVFEGSYNERVFRNQKKNQPSWIIDIITELESTAKFSTFNKINMFLPSVTTCSPKFGKQFDNIRCSRFCGDKILQLNNTMREFIDYCFDTLECDAQLKTNIVFHCSHANLTSARLSLMEETQNKEKVHWEYNFQNPEVLCYNQDVTFENLRMSDCSISRNYFTQLHAALKGLHKGQQLFLCSYPLLTRLHFGIAILIKNLFQSGKIYYESNSKRKKHNVCGIYYENFQGITEEEALWKNLESIFKKCTTTSLHLNVLEVVPVTLLCRNQICHAAVNYNNQLLLTNLQDKVEATQEFFALMH